MASKISVTVDDDVLAAARALAPLGNLSALVNDALAERVRRERLRALVADDVAEMGPIPTDAIVEVDSEWPFSSSTQRLGGVVLTGDVGDVRPLADAAGGQDRISSPLTETSWSAAWQRSDASDGHATFAPCPPGTSHARAVAAPSTSGVVS